VGSAANVGEKRGHQKTIPGEGDYSQEEKLKDVKREVGCRQVRRQTKGASRKRGRFGAKVTKKIKAAGQGQGSKRNTREGGNIKQKTERAGRGDRGGSLAKGSSPVVDLS